MQKLLSLAIFSFFSSEENLQFVFKYIDPKDEDKPFVFTVAITDQNKYKGSVAILCCASTGVHIKYRFDLGVILNYNLNLQYYYVIYLYKHHKINVKFLHYSITCKLLKKKKAFGEILLFYLSLL